MPRSEENCVFCAVVDGDAPAVEIHRDAHTVAFLDIRPIRPGHLLVVPRRHAPRLGDLTDDEAGTLMRAGRRMVRALAASDLGIDGANLVLNDGAAAFQTVHHTHLHVVPRVRRDLVRFATGLVLRRPGDRDAIGAALRAGLARLEEIR